MDNSRIWVLMGKKLAGETTPEETAELNDLLKNNPDAQYLLETFSTLWKPFVKLDEEDMTGYSDELFDRHIRRLAQAGYDMSLSAQESGLSENAHAAVEEYPWEKEAPRRRQIRNYFTGIFMLLVLAAGGYFLFFKISGKKIHPVIAPQYRMNVITTKYGSRSQVTLPDSTQVWLNAGSKLTYSNDFAESPVREVYLSGEALFDVTHKNNQPFVIHTQKLDIRVLGTVFDVRSYPGDKTTETTLLRGAIEVSLHENPSRKIILKPNEKITVYNDQYSLNNIAPVKPLKAIANSSEDMFTISRIHPVTADSVISETSWLDNKLIFQGEDFEDLARQMERKYNVRFHFEDNQVKQYKYTGIFTTESINQALHALEISSPMHPFRFHVNKQDVYIYSK